MDGPFDVTEFRRVLGYLPTGVTIITTNRASGEPVGMTCNSFVSVSLKPSLVMFCVGNTSSTLPDLRRSGTFCVNILGNDQERLARQFSVKGVDRFAGVRWTESAAGPELPDAVAWLSCSTDVEHVAGDHVILVARVNALRENGEESGPLVFHRGGFGSFHRFPRPVAPAGAAPRAGSNGGAPAPSGVSGTVG